jgi:hypothetical protein
MDACSNGPGFGTADTTLAASAIESVYDGASDDDDDAVDSVSGAGGGGGAPVSPPREGSGGGAGASHCVRLLLLNMKNGFMLFRVGDCDGIDC